MASPVKIGNAQAFWGDRGDAAAELLAREPGLDYLTLDYLAEVSMSILALQREREPAAGYARDFVDVLRSLAPYWQSGSKCRVIANAGGLNPRGCAEACAAALRDAGCRSMKIGIVSGDDVLDVIRGMPNGTTRADRFQNLDTGRPSADMLPRLVTANAYFGAAPIVEALRQGAEIVITGRVADPSLVVAPCVHEFGWLWDDVDRLAGATVAGHLIECGTQVTGGISTDWLEIEDAGNISFPIVEVSADGSCVVTKPQGTGGRVNELTVKEQLVYEIGDPARYLSPDVAVSFLSLKVEDPGNDRVRVSGARGSPAPATYKVSATYRDGYRGAGTLTICGRNAVAKARRAGEIVLQRVRDAGHDLRDAVVECLGSGDCVAGVSIGGPPSDALRETVLRIAVEADSRDAVECFARELMPLITSGPQGTTGYAEGRPHVRPVFRFWPCVIEREAVQPVVELIESQMGTSPSAATAGLPRTARRCSVTDAVSVRDTVGARLGDIACARSGDKGINANVGVVARTAGHYPIICEQITAERVVEFFRPLGATGVERFELPTLSALNFIVHGVLSRGLRTDAQGKTLGQTLLELPIDAA
jgi:hypothetical protein